MSESVFRPFDRCIALSHVVRAAVHADACGGQQERISCSWGWDVVPAGHVFDSSQHSWDGGRERIAEVRQVV